MTTELKTFRFEIEPLQRVRAICERRGDLSYHINQAILEYIDKIDKPTKKEAAALKDHTEANSVIDYLNKNAGTNYRHTDGSRKLIGARLKDYDLTELYAVIDKKCKEWKGGSMEKYLRPKTLFNATNFDEYLNQNIIGDNYAKHRRPALESESNIFEDEEFRGKLERKISERDSQ